MQTTLFKDERPKAGGKQQFVQRPYQAEGVRKIVSCLSENQSCFTAMATGTGKTNVAADLIKSMDALDGAVICTPFRDLVTQTASRFRQLGIECTIEMAEMRSTTPVTVACYQSLLSRRRYEQFVRRKLLIVDESHLNYTKQAIQMISHFREWGCKVVGMTASPDRSSGDPISKFYGPMAFSYPYRSALTDGYLVPTKVWMAVIEALDLSKCEGTGREFDLDAMAEAMRKESFVQPLGSLIEQYHEGLPSVVFCVDIPTSEMLRENLHRRGIASSIVHSKMDPEERRMHLHDFESGESNIIINVGCLTTGWDYPPVRKLFLARPTKSKALYQQMFGRGTRALPGVVDGWSTSQQRRDAIAGSAKPYCEVFDITDSCRHNDLQCALDIYDPGMDRQLMRRTRNRIASGASDGVVEGVEPDAIIEAERAAIAAEEAAAYALTAESRKHMVGHAQFGVWGRDTFAEAEKPDKPKGKGRRWHMLFGKYKGWALCDVPTPYLRMFIQKMQCGNKAFMDAIRGEVYRRDQGK
jgi:superfamily II DNA or RNA helicase